VLTFVVESLMFYSVQAFLKQVCSLARALRFVRTTHRFRLHIAGANPCTFFHVMQHRMVVVISTKGPMATGSSSSIWCISSRNHVALQCVSATLARTEISKCGGSTSYRTSVRKTCCWPTATSDWGCGQSLRPGVGKSCLSRSLTRQLLCFRQSHCSA
jgi:hypothetical protein